MPQAFNLVNDCIKKQIRKCEQDNYNRRKTKENKIKKEKKLRFLRSKYDFS